MTRFPVHANQVDRELKRLRLAGFLVEADSLGAIAYDDDYRKVYTAESRTDNDTWFNVWTDPDVTRTVLIP